MSPTRHVQLGILELESLAGPSSSGCHSAWQNLEIDFLRGLSVSTECQEPLESLTYLLQDSGVGCDAHFRRQGSNVLIRLSVLPLDAPGSLWKRKGDAKGWRKKHLSRLFWYLKKGWDSEDAGWVMKRPPEDMMNMAELYTAIPSPLPPDFQRDTVRSPQDLEVFLRLIDLMNPDGIKTQMYLYQLRSLARMIQMETRPSQMLDPRWTAFEEAGKEDSYYVNFETWDIVKYPGRYELPKGGILAEQMGVGKTLICLSLILATKHQAVLPPAVSLDGNTPLTDHSLHTYPFEPYRVARDALGTQEEEVDIKLPSLVDLCANILAGQDHAARNMDYLAPSLVDKVKRQAFYYESPPDDTCMRAAKRAAIRRHTKKILLANTTLVVVPQILLRQWKEEIEKHLEAKALRVLDVGKVMPPVNELMLYDLVLIDVERFGQEEAMRRFHLDLGPSELTKARWKRIVLDEGHVAGAQLSNAMRMAMTLNIERKWIVSGTPTRHLQQGGEMELEAMAIPSSIDLKAETSNGDTRERPVERWSTRDLEDVARIGVMMSRFLGAEPFRSDADFSYRITKQLSDKNGPKFGAVQRIWYLMSQMMVKHAPRVIDEEAMLPPSTTSTEVIRFHPMQKVTYNVLASLVASNVWTSGFEDQDYFLHPSNQRDFNQVVRNLHLACFWYSARDMGIRECLERVKKHLDRDDLSDEAMAALNEAVCHFEKALDTPGWAEWMDNGVSIPCDVDNQGLMRTMPRIWSDSSASCPELIDSHSLTLLRDLNRDGVTLKDLEQKGLKNFGIKQEEFAKDKEKDRNKTSRPAFNGEAKDVSTSASAAHEPLSVPKTTPKKKKQVKDALTVRLEEAEHNATMLVENELAATALCPRPFPASIKIRSRSSKLNFVLDTIISSPEADKYVIFGDKYELGHLTEALDLCDVRSCFVGQNVSRAAQNAALKAFERPDVRVCLLDLRLGARGLNLIMANRIIFLSPVWNLDVLAQAVKRVHRIGQTRTTTIQILVTEGTFEEDIAKRATSRATNSKSTEEEQRYSRAMIERPRFVYPEDLDQRFLPIRFVPVESSSTANAVVESATPSDISPTTPLTKELFDLATIAAPENSPSLRGETWYHSESLLSTLKQTETRLASKENKRDRSGEPLPSAMKRGGDYEAPEAAKRKKARVAFA